MSNLEDTKAQIPSVFWTIANGVFLASGIALIVMRNDYLLQPCFSLKNRGARNYILSYPH